MSPQELTALFAVLGPVAATIATYLALTRRSSGKVNTSEAHDLWERISEQLNMRDTRIAHLEEQNSAQSEQIGKLQAENWDQSMDIKTLTRGKVECLEKVAKLEETISALEKKVNGG